MKQEKSCGCIIINNNKVLLVYEKNQNFWGFPKGHVEQNETEIETAKREVKEEVGLDIKIIEDTRYEFKYTINNNVEKTCVIFLAYPITLQVHNQESEISKSKWFNIEEAIKILPYENQKEALIAIINSQKSTK